MKVFYSVLLLLLLNACAKPLQPDNYGDLISSTQVDQDTFQVSSPGSANSEDEKSVDLSLLRSAEVALKNGFNYFVIVKSDGLENSAYEATTYGGESYAHSDPGTTNTIVCFKEKPQGFAYVALFVKASLRAKYNLDQVAE
jgi:hypothetical protein